MADATVEKVKIAKLTRWSKSEVRDLRKMVKESYEYSYIAKALTKQYGAERTTKSVAQKFSKLRRAKPKSASVKRSVWSVEENEALSTLLARGHGGVEMAKRLSRDGFPKRTAAAVQKHAFVLRSNGAGHSHPAGSLHPDATKEFAPPKLMESNGNGSSKLGILSVVAMLQARPALGRLTEKLAKLPQETLTVVEQLVDMEIGG